MKILFRLEIDDNKGSRIVIPLQKTKERDSVSFFWVDDMDYMCDWAEVTFAHQFGAATGGWESDKVSIPPLTGTEKVFITFGDDMEKDEGKLELEMEIYKLQEKPPHPGARYMVTRMVLINSRLIPLMRPEKNRSFHKTYSAVAEEVAKDAGFKNLIIEPTQGTKTVKQLYWSDAQLLSYMASGSVGSQGSVPYFWHVSGDRFLFHSYEYPQKGEAHTISKIYGYPIRATSEDAKAIETVRRSQCLDWLVEVSPKLNLFAGGSGMTVGGSSFESGYVLKQKTGDEVYNQGGQLDNQMPTESTEMDKFARYEYTGRHVEDLEGFLQNSVARRQRRMIRLTAFLRGKAERKAGKIIEFEHKKMTKASKESKYSGKYLVQRAVHHYTQGEYYNYLTLIRAGYQL